MKDKFNRIKRTIEEHPKTAMFVSGLCFGVGGTIIAMPRLPHQVMVSIRETPEELKQLIEKCDGAVEFVNPDRAQKVVLFTGATL